MPMTVIPETLDAEVCARLKAEAKAAQWKSDFMDTLAEKTRLQAECRAYEHLVQDIALRLGVSGSVTENLAVSDYGPIVLASLKTWREMLDARYTTPEGDPLFAFEQSKREVERLTHELDKAQREREKWKRRAEMHYDTCINLAQAQGFEGPSKYPDFGKNAQEVLDEADEYLRGVLARHAPMRDFYEVKTADGRYYLAVSRTVGYLDAVLSAWAEHYDATPGLPQKMVVTHPDGARHLVEWPQPAKAAEGGEE